MAVIYKIYFNDKPDTIYVGSAVDFNLRKIRHKHQLKKGIHKNIYLQRLYNKYGKENLRFEILEEVENTSILIGREQYFIDLLDPKINVLKVAGSAMGYRHSDETKRKISLINTGRKMTEEQIRKGVLARVGQKTSKGCKRSEHTKKILSEINKRKVLNEKTNQIIPSIGEAAILFNIKYSTLYAKLSGRNANDTWLRFL